jgi:Asp-tRNA(Asn)/Glu-tRNA(Gln) amidotransferase B subunit
MLGFSSLSASVWTKTRAAIARLGLAFGSSKTSRVSEMQRSRRIGERFTPSLCSGGLKFDLELTESNSHRIIHELLGQLAKADLTLANSPVGATELGQLIDAVTSGRLTGTNAKTILRTFLLSPSSRSMSSLITAQLFSSPSIAEIASLCTAVITDLPVEAAKVREGQQNVLMRLVGEVMKRSGGKADAKKVAEVLREALR